MLIIPAVDIKKGKAVRLKQGKMNDVTDFGDPIAAANHWLSLGADRLHIVDLDGASNGKPANSGIISNIVRDAHNTPIQVGGGIRELSTIEHYLNLGVKFVILGSIAVTNYNLTIEACKLFAGRIIISIDAYDGIVATEGWEKASSIQASELVTRYKDTGITNIIYTDISKDGMLGGINLDSTIEIAKNSHVPIIASGGIGSIEDIQNVINIAKYGIEGIICGRALYEGRLEFSQALEIGRS